ncbi:MAG: helix-turn-helix domain-containing protein [Planctomycetota bacterium]
MNSESEENSPRDELVPVRRRLPDREILNIDEAALLLGVSVKTFNKVLHTEDMPARKIGREWKFSRRALIDWVGSGRSREFYRDSSDADQGEEPVAQERPKARRTAGWHIEMD